jgi:hypothetical protein
VETREHQIAEIARWLKLPPHKLMHAMGQRPGGNLESSETDYHITTLLTWTTLIAQLCNRKLISSAQRPTYYTEHNYGRRLQPTPIQRMAIQAGYQKMGVLTAEQIARQENLPKPKPAPAPPALSAPPPADPPADPTADPVPAARTMRITTAQRALLTTIVTRYIRREGENAKRASKKGAAAFEEWANTFYAAGESAVLRESLEPAVALCLATSGSPEDPRPLTAAFSERHQERSKTELLELRAKDLDTAVPALLKKWETSRVIEGVEELMAALDAAEENEHVA